MRKDPRVARQLDRMLLCSLLGNFEDESCIKTRPQSIALRKYLYDTFDSRRAGTYEAAFKFRRKLMTTATYRVYMNAIQQYLCYSIRTNEVF